MSQFSSESGWAREQDAADPLAPFRTEFSLPSDPAGRPLAYFAGNSLGLMPAAAGAAVRAELDDWARLGVAGHLEGKTPWYRYHETVREPLARLVGAGPEEVVAMNTLTVNLHLMLVTFYRPEGGRRKVLIEKGAFPSDAYAIETHLASRGIGSEAILAAEPQEVEEVIARHGGEIAVIWLGAVHYYSGAALDLESLTRAGHQAGCVVGFDLAHAAGNLELRLHEWDVDFAVWCSYKYLNAGPGAVGGCFLHQRHATRPDLPRYGGWWGNDPETRFRMAANRGFVPVASADGWQLSNPPILSLAPLRTSLDQFDRAGMAALRRKSLRLTGYLEFLLTRRPDSRFTIITPEDPARRGCQLSIRLASVPAHQMVTDLAGLGIVVDHRDPDVIRVAPVPLYNTFQEVERFSRAFLEALP